MLGWLWTKGRARLKTLTELPQIPLQIPQPDGTRVPIMLQAAQQAEDDVLAVQRMVQEAMGLSQAFHAGAVAGGMKPMRVP